MYQLHEIPQKANSMYVAPLNVKIPLNVKMPLNVKKIYAKCENSAKCEKSTLNVKKEGPLNMKKYLR